MPPKYPGAEDSPISQNKDVSGGRQYVILVSSDKDLKDGKILKLLSAKNLLSAEREAIGWLLGEGLPCDGCVTDVYSLVEVLVCNQATAKLLWETHLLVDKLPKK